MTTIQRIYNNMSDVERLRFFPDDDHQGTERSYANGARTNMQVVWETLYWTVTLPYWRWQGRRQTSV